MGFLHKTYKENENGQDVTQGSAAGHGLALADLLRSNRRAGGLLEATALVGPGRLPGCAWLLGRKALPGCLALADWPTAWLCLSQADCLGLPGALSDSCLAVWLWLASWLAVWLLPGCVALALAGWLTG